MAPRRHRVPARLPRRRRRAAERAIATIEMAILTPVMLLLVTFSTQAALWQEADHVALAAAESGVAAGTQVGGSPAGAKGQALSAASQMGSGVLISPGATVTVTLPPGVKSLTLVLAVKPLQAAPAPWTEACAALCAADWAWSGSAARDAARAALYAAAVAYAWAWAYRPPATPSSASSSTGSMRSDISRVATPPWRRRELREAIM